MPDADTTKVYPCPLPDCGFALLGEAPGPAEDEGALAELFGLGVFAAHARNQRLQYAERTLREHLNTHTVQEFAIALAGANKQILQLTADRVTAQ